MNRFHTSHTKPWLLRGYVTRRGKGCSCISQEHKRASTAIHNKLQAQVSPALGVPKQKQGVPTREIAGRSLSMIRKKRGRYPNSWMGYNGKSYLDELGVPRFRKPQNGCVWKGGGTTKQNKMMIGKWRRHLRVLCFKTNSNDSTFVYLMFQSFLAWLEKHRHT